MWEWDETLFLGSAAFYRAGRLPYPAELADAFRDELGLDGRGRLLDVGCGTGEIAAPLAPLYAEVVGLDADAGMIEAARERGVPNARFVQARAEELPLGLGTFRTATFAQSFHWMQRERVAATVREMLEPGGSWVHVDTGSQEVGGDVPRDEIRTLVVSYLGPARRAGQGVRETSPSDEDEIMVASGYSGPHVRRVCGPRTFERSADDIVANVFSLSGSAPHLFGDRLGDFERDLRALLGGRTFTEITPPLQLRVWTRP